MTVEVLANRSRLAEYEQHAVDDVARGDDELALRRISEGAQWCWDHHPGLFASPTFERLIGEIGTRAVAASPSTGSGSFARLLAGSRRGGRRVLHVLTRAYETGGHTRVTARWIELDTEREHSVILTSPEHFGLPDVLSAAPSQRVMVLHGTSEVERVRNLARMLPDYDLVVLNIHPHDAVAAAACAGSPQRPRTILLNHADHVFWVGVGAADQIIDMRPSAVPITTTRRSLAPDVSQLVPLPIRITKRDVERGLEFRATHGIPADARVTLSLADPYKFHVDSGPSFVDLLARVLESRDDLHHVAIGPDASSELWAPLVARFPDRVHVLGRTTEYRASLDAADAFTDSFPFSAMTASLEAAAHGLAVLSLEAEPASPLGFDDVAVTPHVASDEQEWVSTLLNWCERPEVAREFGSRLREQCERVHGERAWMHRVDQLLASRWSREHQLFVPEPGAPDAIDAAIERLARLRLERGN